MIGVKKGSLDQASVFLEIRMNAPLLPCQPFRYHDRQLKSRTPMQNRGALSARLGNCRFDPEPAPTSDPT